MNFKGSKRGQAHQKRWLNHIQAPNNKRPLGGTCCHFGSTHNFLFPGKRCGARGHSGGFLCVFFKVDFEFAKKGKFGRVLVRFVSSSAEYLLSQALSSDGGCQSCQSAIRPWEDGSRCPSARIIPPVRAAHPARCFPSFFGGAGHDSFRGC